ncbi:MAG: helix-turn-helix domain-containing protein [Christensenellales bacterium]|jgi:transcriptional regulator with XRE-family HTH domain
MVGTRLKELRSNEKMSQASLGEILGVTQQSIAAWETEKSEPGNESLVVLAKLFDVSTDYLLGLSNERYKQTFITSSGRKLTVEMASKEPLTAEEQKEIEAFFSSAENVDELPESVQNIIRKVVEQVLDEREKSK